MVRKTKPRTTPEDKASVPKALRTVSYSEGFHFFRDLGDPTGIVALGVKEFVEKISTVDVDSVNFHFVRKDFEKWVSDVLGDKELSGSIGKIRRQTRGEKLRKQITKTVNARIAELAEKD